MNPLDSIAIPLAGLQLADDKDGVRIWENAEGDAVALYYFGIEPDLPADLDSLEALQLGLSKRISATGAAIVDVQVTTVGGCRAVRQCVKLPQKPTGMTYLGSFILPFRDFSFVVKIQCDELGVTGIRDTVVFAAKRGSGQVQLNPENGNVMGWMKDPYDAARTSGLARNLADDEEHDQTFPDHPLSRVRRLMKAVEPSVTVTEDIRQAAPFVSRPRVSGKNPWWKLW